MLKFQATTQYKKDYKKMVKQGKNISELNKVIATLLEEKPLPAKNRDHALTGNYVHHRECHVSPDWLLIYRIDSGSLILTAVRTGSHSDLFQK